MANGWLLSDGWLMTDSISHQPSAISH